MDDLDRLLAFLASVSADPLEFVLKSFPWGEGELYGKTGPEPWQRDLLIRLRSVSPNVAVREAVASGHGVGKSTLVSWIILWALSTATDTRGVVTANTETQLKTKTWAELAKWYRLFIGKELFRFEATSIFSRDPDHSKTWRVDMVPWSERNPEAFAGLHNQSRRVFMIYDEASSIPDIIWETSEGFMTDAETERFWLVCGNPTRTAGYFVKCFDSEIWHFTQVDARDVSFTNKEQIKAWERAYGEDSDFFRVRVRGIFPRIGESSFISASVVHDARSRDVDVSRYDPLILGVDVARFGDDSTRISCRKGRDARSIPSLELRGADTMEVASRVASLAASLNADAIFIDEGGVGGGVVDRCRQLRLHVIGVQFGGKADNWDMTSGPEKYANKRAEIWGSMRAWLNGGAIEDSDALFDELTNLTYGFNSRDEIQLERKEDLKKRGLPSPDWADSLALTFAYPVVANLEAGHIGPHKNLVVFEYDPFNMEAA
jgi:hypothetical protein